MRKSLFGIILFSLSVTAGYTQTIDTVHAALQEQYSPATAVRDAFFDIPALKNLQRNFDYARISTAYFNKQEDVFLPQNGKGRKGFYIDAASYYKNRNKLTLWGNAKYSNQTAIKVKYNESLDYDLIYPYVMADSVGGNIKMESYAISGGLAKKLGKVYYGLQTGYLGVQNYRDRDPRPNNISSDINAALSAAISLNTQYRLALNITGHKYNQRNRLSFENELGYPLVYHDAGLGAYNVMLAGDRMVAYVNATSWSPSINLVTAKEKGFLFKTGYQQFSLRKRLDDIKQSIATAKENRFFVDLGYVKNGLHTVYTVEVNAGIKKRKGTEAIFNNSGGSAGYQKIAERLSFIDDIQEFGIKGVYEKKYDTYSWAAGANGTFRQHEIKYINPLRTLNYDNITVSAFVQASIRVKKNTIRGRFDVTKSFINTPSFSWPDVQADSGIAAMLAQTYQFYTTPFYTLGPSVNLSRPIGKSFIIYGDISARFTQYDTPQQYKGEQFMVTVGLGF
jgi:hypothetical protein